jgi:lincosamide nucleotidyltransferase A/C/D/E
VRFEEVTRVLDGLEAARVRYWVAGGWGVAVLAGRQTRVHRDIDLAIDAAELDACLSTLRDLGYVVETDWLPVRVELKGASDVWVDVHPLSFDSNGQGRQAALDGADFVYPPGAFSAGVLCGRRIACLSREQQRAFHQGYALQHKDRHDLQQLEHLDRPT